METHVQRSSVRTRLDRQTQTIDLIATDFKAKNRRELKNFLVPRHRAKVQLVASCSSNKEVMRRTTSFRVPSNQARCRPIIIVTSPSDAVNITAWLSCLNIYFESRLYAISICLTFSHQPDLYQSQ